MAGKHSFKYSKGSKQSVCQDCGYGEIQPLAAQIACLPCPPAGVRCESKSTLDVSSGYYLLDGSALPSRCPQPLNCLGGVAAGNASCAEGTTGLLCSTCTVNWHQGVRGCEPCSASGNTLWGILMGLFVATAGLWALHRYVSSQLPMLRGREVGDGDVPKGSDDTETASRSNVDACWQCVKARCVEVLHRLRVWLPASGSRQAMTIAKVLISYLQVLDVFAFFAYVDWPQVFLAFLKALDISAILGIRLWVGDLLLPFECALSVPVGFYARLVITLVLPIAASVIVFAVATVVARNARLDGPARAALFTSPPVFNVHVWTVLLLYPSICRVTLQAFQCTPLCDTPTLLMNTTDALCDGETYTTYRLFQDPSIQCYTGEWAFWALVAALGIVVYCLGAPLAFLWLCAKHRHSADGRNRIGVLLASYTPECWYYEAIEMIRKFLLTSVVLVVDPNSRVQLWFGLVFSIAFVLLTTALRPYRDLLPGTVQVAAQVQIVFNYCAANLFFFVPSTIVGAAETPSNGIGALLVIANMFAFAVLIATIAIGIRQQQRTLSEIRLVDSNGAAVTVIDPPRSSTHGYHLFLSHMCKWGQNQADALKSMLQVLLPTLRCFLDVDNLLDMTQLEQHVMQSDVVLVMLTQGYLASSNCRRELIEALRLKKPLVVLRETDPNHGAIELSALRDEVEVLPMQADREAGGALIRMVEDGQTLEWHREGHLKRAVLAAIAQELLDFQSAAAASSGRVALRVIQKHEASRASVTGRSPERKGASAMGGPRVHLLSEYADAVPELETQCT